MLKDEKCSTNSSCYSEKWYGALHVSNINEAETNAICSRIDDGAFNWSWQRYNVLLNVVLYLRHDPHFESYAVSFVCGIDWITQTEIVVVAKNIETIVRYKLMKYFETSSAQYCTFFYPGACRWFISRYCPILLTCQMHTDYTFIAHDILILDKYSMVFVRCTDNNQQLDGFTFLSVAYDWYRL